MQKPVIYLDVCCLNRPFDSQEQARVRFESSAVLSVLMEIEEERFQLLNSEALNQEIANNPDVVRRRRIERVLNLATRVIPVGPTETARAQTIQQLGIKAFDALHLACAESGGANAFLTTDDRLRRSSLRHKNDLKVKVVNPVDWLWEMEQ